MRKIRSFISIVKNGIKGAWRQKGAGLLSAFSITAIMIVMGLILFSVLNINSLVKSLNSKLDQIVIYLDYDISTEEAEDFLDDVSQISGIKRVTYLSKAAALEDAKEKFKDSLFVNVRLREGVVPPSVILEVEELELAEDIIDSIRDRSEVEEIRYPKDMIEKFVAIDKVAKIGGLVAVLGILIISIFIISNIIKMAIAGRGHEIEIMKYIGASEAFIKGPFVIEGVFFSLLGCVLSFGLMYFFYGKFYSIYGDLVVEYLDTELVRLVDVSYDILLIYLSVGLGIGLIGSLRSIKKYLKV